MAFTEKLWKQPKSVDFLMQCKHMQAKNEAGKGDSKATKLEYSHFLKRDGAEPGGKDFCKGARSSWRHCTWSECKDRRTGRRANISGLTEGS